MSQPESEKPLPVSMWKDDKLRPWTIDNDLEAEIGGANNTLQDMIQNTSGSKMAGGRGMSSIDHKPESFLQFEVRPNPSFLCPFSVHSLSFLFLSLPFSSFLFLSLVTPALAASCIAHTNQRAHTNSLPLKMPTPLSLSPLTSRRK